MPEDPVITNIGGHDSPPIGHFYGRPYWDAPSIIDAMIDTIGPLPQTPPLEEGHFEQTGTIGPPPGVAVMAFVSADGIDAAIASLYANTVSAWNARTAAITQAAMALLASMTKKP